MRVARHSPILLSQIPPPRSGTGARWEADAPLDIVFYCLEQTAPKRRDMGARLMTLVSSTATHLSTSTCFDFFHCAVKLINLTSTIHFDLNLFVTSVYTRLSSSSLTTSTDTFSALFSVLAPVPQVSKFKLALCKKYLTSSTTNTSSSDGPQPASRPRPQARAPRALQPSGVPEHEDSLSSVKSVKSSSTSATSVASRYPLPPPSEILQLITQPPSGSFTLTQSLRIKFELLMSYSLVRKTANEPGHQELEWRQMLLDGRVQKAADSAFVGEAGGMYRETLQAVMGTL